MRWFDPRLLNSGSLIVGAGVLAVVLAMNSDVQAKLWPNQHHPGKQSHLVSDDDTSRSEKHDEMRDDRHGRSKKRVVARQLIAALFAKLDKLLLAINSLPVDTALSAKLDELLLAINSLPPGTALSAKLEELLLAINSLPAGTALSAKLDALTGKFDDLLSMINALPTGTALTAKLDEVVVAINGPPTGVTLPTMLDEVLLAINGPPTGTTLPAKLDQVLAALNGQPGSGTPPCGGDTESNRFVMSTDGTEVCDKTTGLHWEQMPDTVPRQWQAAIAFCPTLGSGYRLPEVKELLSLVDFSQFDPALPASHPFSNAQSSIYWSATGTAFPTDACSVVFRDGAISRSFKTNPLNVWCVRNGP